MNGFLYKSHEGRIHELMLFFLSFAGRIPSFHRSFIATRQVICLRLVQSSSGQTEILQET